MKNRTVCHIFPWFGNFVIFLITRDFLIFFILAKYGFSQLSSSVKICKKALSSPLVFFVLCKIPISFLHSPDKFVIVGNSGFFHIFHRVFHGGSVEKPRFHAILWGRTRVFHKAIVDCVEKQSQTSSFEIDKKLSRKMTISFFLEPKTNKFSVTLNERFYENLHK